MKLLIIIFVIIYNGNNLVNANCGPCPAEPLHYVELGCTKVSIDSERDPCCMTTFSCPDFNTYDKNVCHFNGTTINPGEQLGIDGCMKHCVCLNSSSDKDANFNCPIIDCPRNFDESEKCVTQQTFDGCCPTKRICDKEEIENLHKCYLYGTEHRNGEMFNPINPREKCYRCLCDETFNNATSIPLNEHCRKIQCGTEIRKLDYIKKGCAPVYPGDDGCCPENYRCPKDDDEFENISGFKVEEAKDLRSTCQYGKFVLPKHGQLKISDNCITCTCKTPPIVTCVRQLNCK